MFGQEGSQVNKFNLLMVHKGHLERLILTKSTINNKRPLTPSFFKKRKKNGIEREKELIIKQDNNVMYKKLYSISCHKSKCSSVENIPRKCPAFIKNKKRYIINQKKINKENELFGKILYRSKSTYSSNKIDESFFYNQYLKSNISQSKIHKNPNLKYITFGQFRKKIVNNMKNNSFYNNSNNSLISNKSEGIFYPFNFIENSYKIPKNPLFRRVVFNDKKYNK